MVFSGIMHWRTSIALKRVFLGFKLIYSRAYHTGNHIFKICFGAFKHYVNGLMAAARRKICVDAALMCSVLFMTGPRWMTVLAVAIHVCKTVLQSWSLDNQLIGNKSNANLREILLKRIITGSIFCTKNPIWNYQLKQIPRWMRFYSRNTPSALIFTPQPRWTIDRPCIQFEVWELREQKFDSCRLGFWYHLNFQDQQYRLVLHQHWSRASAPR